MSKSFEIKGLKELEKQLSENATLEDVKPIVKMHGAKLQEYSMRKVVVDTGTLKRSIMLSSHDNGYTTRIKALVDYASYVEWGTRYQTAQPFIKPSYDKVKIQFKKDLERLFK